MAAKVSKKRSLPVVNKKLPLIVVDAGHGGSDLGAKGYRGIQEKNVNLAIALRLKDILTSRYRYRVILTRGDDTFIPLPGRGKIANDNNADVFVSAHANAAVCTATAGGDVAAAVTAGTSETFTIAITDTKNGDYATVQLKLGNA